MNPDARLEDLYLFDDHGMPAGPFGYQVYRDLLDRIGQFNESSREAPLSALYEVVTPRSTRMLLHERGLDLTDLPDQDPDAATVGVHVRQYEPGSEVTFSSLWGFVPPPEVGALIWSRARTPDASGAQLVLVTRSGFRGVLVQESSHRVHLEVAGPREAPPAFFGSSGLLLERAIQSASSSTPADPVVSVGQFIAVETVNGTADALSLAQADGIDDPGALYLLAFASSVIRAFRLAVALGGGDGDPRVSAMREVLLHIRRSPGNISSSFNRLETALQECQKVARTDWVSTLRNPSAAALLTPILPSPVISNPAWGGSDLIGFMLGTAREAESAATKLAELAADQREVVVELLQSCGLELPD